MNLETKYNIDDRVEIIELARTGSVINISYDGTRLNYTIRYFDNGTPLNTVFYDAEIKKVGK